MLVDVVCVGFGAGLRVVGCGFGVALWVGDGLTVCDGLALWVAAGVAVLVVYVGAASSGWGASLAASVGVLAGPSFSLATVPAPAEARVMAAKTPMAILPVRLIPGLPSCP